MQYSSLNVIHLEVKIIQIFLPGCCWRFLILRKPETSESKRSEARSGTGKEKAGHNQHTSSVETFPHTGKARDLDGEKIRSTKRNWQRESKCGSPAILFRKYFLNKKAKPATWTEKRSEARSGTGKEKNGCW